MLVYHSRKPVFRPKMAISLILALLKIAILGKTGLRE
jgi:hypothetical protein